LNKVLGCFDGNLSVKGSIAQFPTGLKPYGIDVIVWLLRWNIIREGYLCSYILFLQLFMNLHPVEVYLVDLSLYDAAAVEATGSSPSINSNQHDCILLEKLKPFLTGLSSFRLAHLSLEVP
jgi:hypothetical protein